MKRARGVTCNRALNNEGSTTQSSREKTDDVEGRITNTRRPSSYVLDREINENWPSSSVAT